MKPILYDRDREQYLVDIALVANENSRQYHFAAAKAYSKRNADSPLAKELSGDMYKMSLMHVAAVIDAVLAYKENKNENML